MNIDKLSLDDLILKFRRTGCWIVLATVYISKVLNPTSLNRLKQKKIISNKYILQDAVNSKKTPINTSDKRRQNDQVTIEQTILLK